MNNTPGIYIQQIDTPLDSGKKISGRVSFQKNPINEHFERNRKIRGTTFLSGLNISSNDGPISSQPLGDKKVFLFEDLADTQARGSRNYNSKYNDITSELARGSLSKLDPRKEKIKNEPQTKRYMKN